MIEFFYSNRTKLLINAFFAILFAVVVFHVVNNFIELSKIKSKYDDKVSETWKALGIDSSKNNKNDDRKSLLSDKIASILAFVKEEGKNTNFLPLITLDDVTSTIKEKEKDNNNNKTIIDYNFRNSFSRIVLNSMALINEGNNMPHVINDNVAIISTSMVITDFKSTKRPIGFSIQQDNNSNIDVVSLINIILDKIHVDKKEDLNKNIFITNIIQYSSNKNNILVPPNTIYVKSPLFALYILKKYGINKAANDFLNSINTNFFKHIEENSINLDDYKEYNYSVDTFDQIAAAESSNNLFTIINDTDDSGSDCGVISELLLASLNNGSIPIYFGSSIDNVETYFNKDCFVNGKKFSTKKDCLDYVSANFSNIKLKAMECKNIYNLELHKLAKICFYGKFYRDYFNSVDLFGKSEYLEFLKPITLIDYDNTHGSNKVRLCFFDEISQGQKNIVITMCIKIGLLYEDYKHNYDDDLLSSHNLIVKDGEIIIWFGRGNKKDDKENISAMTIECINRRAKKELFACYESINDPNINNMAVSLEMIGTFTISKNDYNTTINDSEMITHVVNWIK